MHVRGTMRIADETIRNTQDCESICVQTIQHALEHGEVHADPNHIRLLQDCADICDTVNKFVLRSSPHHAELMAACASICEACASSCERFIGDAQMKACANQCRLCASACRQMVSATAGLSESSLRGIGMPGVASTGYQAAGLQGAPVR